MIKIVALTRRELGVYFVSPMAYIILTAFLFFTGFFFYWEIHTQVARHAPASFEGTFNTITSLVMFITPLVTMRLVAEETARGTIESMMTAPVSELQFILSKYFAAMLFFVFLLLPTVGYVLIIDRLTEGASIDAGAIAMGYAGLVLFLAVITSIGLFISAMSSSYVVAGVITLVVMILPFALKQLEAWFESPVLKKAVAYAALPEHMNNFSRGMLDTRDLVYFGSIVAFFLGGTVLVVGSRRWR